MIKRNKKTEVCIFGFYDPNYSRNRVLLKGMRANGISVVECNSCKKGIAKYIDLARKHWKIRKEYDILFVAYPGYMSIILARLITSKKIMYDAFFSIYDSVVNDRVEFKGRSIKGIYYWCIDWIACILADRIILDTNANIEYFVSTFKIRRDKFVRIFVGSDEKVIFPEETERSGTFTVHFHGGFNPMQGVQYIIKTAHILKDEDIKFRIIGRGQTHASDIMLAKKLGIKNIEFISEIVSYGKLRTYMNKSDICLGIFSTNKKADIVVPNKAYEAIAVKKSLITRDSVAVRELFSDGVNCLFCRPGDAKDLADKIMLLYHDKKLCDSIALNGYTLFLSKLTPPILGKELLRHIKTL